MQTRFVYIIEKPGSELDGEDTIVRADNRVDADADAERRRKAWGCKSMRFIGTREGARFVPGVPENELPEWARQGAA